jgi:fumarate reductase flavoprotein subunit
MKLGTLILAMAGLWFAGLSALLPPNSVGAAGNSFLADKHKDKGTDCSGCHKESPPKQDVSMAVCLGCHGDYRKVAARTSKIDPNPHDSHLGEIECGKCHHAHKASVMVCAPCHQFDMNVP